jgi:hypothetical protein
VAKQSAKKKSDDISIVSVQARTRLTRVSSPTVPGAVESVQRRVDHLEVMRRASQLTPRQWQALELYRNSREIVYGGAGNSMDFERSRGSSLPGSPPLPTFMRAASVISDAKRILYPLDHKIVVTILGGGETEPPQTFKSASIVLGYHHREIAQRFKIAMEVLADEYFGTINNDKSQIRTYLPKESRPTQSDLTEVSQSATAHISQHKVAWRC